VVYVEEKPTYNRNRNAPVRGYGTQRVRSQERFTEPASRSGYRRNNQQTFGKMEYRGMKKRRHQSTVGGSRTRGYSRNPSPRYRSNLSDTDMNRRRARSNGRNQYKTVYQNTAN